MRKKVLCVLVATALTAGLMTGCGSKDASSESVPVIDESMTDAEAGTEAKDAGAEGTDAATVAGETEAAGTQQYTTAKEWVDSLGLEEPTLLIWNEETKENTVLGEGEEYQLKENDKILIGGVGGMREFDCEPGYIFNGFDPSAEQYADLQLDIEGKQDVLMTLNVKEKEYELAATFIGVSGEILTAEGVTTIEEIDINSTLPGEEWVASFGREIAEPFAVIWNDMDGTKKILEKGEKYQLNEGDMFFIYCPEYANFEIVDPLEIILDAEELSNGQLIQLDESYIEKNGEVEAKFYVNGDEIFKLPYIFTK